ncbi:glycosyltransferase BC10-like [Trifolium pratense]|uniref:glycosyltransferase BC10-like n=1 Tax=Trifolium pratense TaxID=57577 RepID=UPI001E690103|nr:glycosyltransferase BC10-like [Trifolium pratense]
MKNSNNQQSLNSISRHFNSNNLQLIRFLSYFIFLAFGVTIGIIISFYLKTFNLSFQFTQFSSQKESQIPSPPLQPVVYNSSLNHTHIGLKKFIEPSHVVHDLSDDELLWRASLSPKIDEYPFDRVPKVAFLFLVRGPVTLAPLWEKFFQGHNGYYSIYVHSNPSYNGSEVESPVFHGRRIPSKKVEWGKFNMIEAERRLLANALLDFSNQRFVLISESCIPLFNFSTIYSYLMNSTLNYVMAYDKPSSVGRGRYRIKMSPTIKLRQWRKGSQWFEMDRKLALEVISDRTYYPTFEKYCTGSCYADEHYLPTLVSIKFWKRNSNRSLTWVDWSKGGPHPVKYVRPEVTCEFLENLRNQTCEYNGNSTNVCFLFARKFLPTSLTRLMRFAPKVMHL